ncbi:MAG TPA: hypothetical protein VEL31_07625 [Ktedonobacteraceae bacterium]|nr:hypothetical protein [Ktedonobacteraceae bacterium]
MTQLLGVNTVLFSKTTERWESLWWGIKPKRTSVLPSRCDFGLPHAARLSKSSGHDPWLDSLILVGVGPLERTSSFLRHIKFVSQPVQVVRLIDEIRGSKRDE